MNVSNQTEFVHQLEVWMRSGIQAIHVAAGCQAALAEDLIWRAYQNRWSQKGRRAEAESGPNATRLVTWDVVNGLRLRQPESQANADRLPESVNFRRAIEIICSPDPGTEQLRMLGNRCCVILRDPHHFLKQDPAALSVFKEAVKSNRFWHFRGSNGDDIMRQVVIITNGHSLGDELSGYVKSVDLPLPVKSEIEDVLNRLMPLWPDAIKNELGAGTPARDVIKQALAGLPSIDIENVLSEAVVRHYSGQSASLDARVRLERVRGTVERQKAATLRRTEALTYIPLEEVLEAPELCGYENLDRWVQVRRAAYTPQAAELKIDRPKGLAITGIPGSGKSVAVKMIAKRFEKPLVMFDIAAVFGSLVGESERKMREALSAVTALENCVLAVDEIDKALGGSHESSGDSGVTRRVLGKFLSWLADKNDGVFVVFTMNRIEQLPPELTRRGRLDEIFWVDLPNADTRVAILKLHLSRRGVDLSTYSPEDWDRLAQATDGFVGAEIEDVVKSARLEALLANLPNATPSVALLAETAKKVQPLSKTDNNGLDAIRTFSKGRAVPVGDAAPERPNRQTKVSKPSARGLDIGRGGMTEHN